VLIALNIEYSQWGFEFFVVSCVYWIGFPLYSNASGLLFQSIAFLLINLLGIYRWFFSRSV